MINGLRVQIMIGAREVLRCPHLEIVSLRHSPLDHADVTLPDPAGELYRDIRTGEPVAISLGYRDQPQGVWQGTVSRVRPGTTRDQLELSASGPELPLATTRIRQSWEHEDPAAIVRYCVAAAGLLSGRIDSPGPLLPRFVASDIPVWQVARQCALTCRRSFGVDMSRWALWIGADGRVNWGDFDEPGEVPVIATGAGLIEHLPGSPSAAQLSRVSTFLLAGFAASRLFRLRDTRRGVDGLFRSLVVRHTVMPTSVRTHLEYGAEYGRD